jgi:endonuclease YncB( thermonuclease family)
MLKFPKDRIYPRRRRSLSRTIFITLLFAGLSVASLYFGDSVRPRAPVAINGEKIIVMDGDSFVIGTRKFRLNGIDAPEYRQNCNDAAGRQWPCGRTARAALETLLTQPGLACETSAKDRYNRAIAHCRTARTPDIAASQVREGMAVSNQHYGIRSYGGEEDAAQAAKRGIWQGNFLQPSDYRALGKAGLD